MSQQRISRRKQSVGTYPSISQSAFICDKSVGWRVCSKSWRLIIARAFTQKFPSNNLKWRNRLFDFYGNETATCVCVFRRSAYVKLCKGGLSADLLKFSGLNGDEFDG